MRDIQMKNFFKKLSFVMALALILTSLAPAGSASAAAKMKMDKSKVILYLTEENVKGTPDNYDFTIKNKPEDWKKTLSFQWESSNEDVATVKAGGKTQGVGVGEATITCTITDKETDKVVASPTAKVTVKANAAKIEINNVPEDGIVGIGEAVYNLNRTMYDAEGNKTTKRGVYVTDYTRWISSDETIATVDKNGVISTLKAGEFTITAETYQSSKNPQTFASTSVTLKAMPGVVGVKQVKANVIEITYDSDVESLVTTGTLDIAPALGTVVKPVIKSVSFDSTKKIATVTSYINFTDKAEYIITVKDAENLKSNFVASVGEVASIEITGPSKVIESKTDGTIKYNLYDANGVIVSAGSSASVDFEFVSDEDNGYFSTDNDGKASICVFSAGKQTVIKAIYRTGQYTSEGTEITIESAPFVVVGVKESDITIADSKYTVAENAPANWDTMTPNYTLGLEDYDKTLYVYMKDENGTKYTTNDEYTFESMDTSKIEVDANGKLFPIAQGTAYIKVKNTTNEKVVLCQITIGAKAAVTNFVFDKYSATVSSKVAEKVIFKATVKDQYQTDKNLETLYADGTCKIAASKDANTSDIGSILVLDGNTVTFTGGVPAGTYTYKFTVNNITRTLSIVVKDPDGATTNKFFMSANVYDIVVNEGTGTPEPITFEIYEVAKNGIKVAAVDTANYSVKLTAPDGTETTLSLLNGVYAFEPLTVNGTEYTKAAAAGTYRVEVTMNSKVFAKASFIIKDSQEVIKVTQNSTSQAAVAASGSAVTGSVIATVNKAFSATGGNGKSLEIVDVDFTNVSAELETDNDTIKSAGKIVVNKVTVKVTLYNNNTYTKVVDVKKALTIK